ncbi:MAG: hypothetical protein P5684_23750 [Limnospira sp. PMC 1238.20]|nr:MULTISPECIES: hypothetical protein [unclassified Limnospira]MDT9323625.1 hypothetical protein [Limnospira sp. PMC 1290.21]MDT9180622.1 hypothetical protein [Limnospira sp. PMC 1238.20]MDT9211341.1 hypothetical protein [Limnospira sp. PMC 1252.20]MDT9246928.1 hypothetical protein [Limnospira sp. PMC 1249.20]MDT9252150.1 hypothetical protein [Limnospira sp. PMC 1280.21]
MTHDLQHLTESKNNYTGTWLANKVPFFWGSVDIISNKNGFTANLTYDNGATINGVGVQFFEIDGFDYDLVVFENFFEIVFDLNENLKNDDNHNAPKLFFFIKKSENYIEVLNHNYFLSVYAERNPNNVRVQSSNDQSDLNSNLFIVNEINREFIRDFLEHFRSGDKKNFKFYRKNNTNIIP